MLIYFSILNWTPLKSSTPSTTGIFQQFQKYPALLKSTAFWGYCLCAAFASGCFFAYLGGAPYVGNQVFGLSSSQIGKLFALTAVGYAMGNFVAGRFSARVGMNRMVVVLRTIALCGPHIRGDEPDAKVMAAFPRSRSPHTWG